MSAADEAWREWNDKPEHDWPDGGAAHAAFLAAYRRAMEDAADAIEPKGPSAATPTGQAIWQCAQVLLARAAAVAPRETKD